MLKEALIFSTGLIVGGVGIGLACELKYKKRMEEFEDKYDDLYSDYSETKMKIAEIENSRSEFSVENEDAEDISEIETTQQEQVNDELKKTAEKLRKNYAGTTQYAQMYQNDDDGPSNDEADNAEEPDDDYIDEAELEEFEQHQQNRTRPPRLISEDALEDLPASVETRTLFYWYEDDILTTEEEEVIDAVEATVGDCLEKYGFTTNDEKTVFVLNYAHNICYEVTKIFGAFGDHR